MTKRALRRGRGPAARRARDRRSAGGRRLRWSPRDAERRPQRGCRRARVEEGSAGSAAPTPSSTRRRRPSFAVGPTWWPLTRARVTVKGTFFLAAAAAALRFGRRADRDRGCRGLRGVAEPHAAHCRERPGDADAGSPGHSPEVRVCGRARTRGRRQTEVRQASRTLLGRIGRRRMSPGRLPIWQAPIFAKDTACGRLGRLAQSTRPPRSHDCGNSGPRPARDDRQQLTAPATGDRGAFRTLRALRALVLGSRRRLGDRGRAGTPSGRSRRSALGGRTPRARPRRSVGLRRRSQRDRRPARSKTEIRGRSREASSTRPRRPGQQNWSRGAPRAGGDAEREREVINLAY